MQRLAFRAPGPERLRLTAEIVGNDTVCGFENVAGRTVVLFQFNHGCIRIMVFKIQNITDVGAAEFVNGLVVVADNTEISLNLTLLIGKMRKKADELKLYRVGILVLVDKDILKTAAIVV